MNRRAFLTNTSTALATLLVALKAEGKTPEEQIKAIEVASQGLPPVNVEELQKDLDIKYPSVTLIFTPLHYAVTPYLSASFDRYCQILGLPKEDGVWTPHHRIQRKVGWEEQSKNVRNFWNETRKGNKDQFVTFCGVEKDKHPFLQTTCFDWERMADNAFVITQEGVRVIKDRDDKYHDVSWGNGHRDAFNSRKLVGFVK